MIRALAGRLLALFYRRVEVVGAERIPGHGPLIVAANHQNALVDPMLLLVTVPRRLVPLAKAPLFHHPIIAPFLRLAGAIPVERRQDTGARVAHNESMFTAAAGALEEGGALLIFPEGVSQSQPVLMPLRTGAARILLSCAPEVAAKVTLLPVGLTFHQPGRFRAGWALVLAGRPVATADCVALHASAPDVAVQRITDRLADALRGLIAEVGDRETLHLVERAEAIWRAENPDGPRDPAARAAWRRRAAAAYRYLLAHEPERVRAVRGEIERYGRDLETAGLGELQLSHSYTVAAVTRYAASRGAELLLGFPLALWGLATHALPYWLTRLAVGLLRPEPDGEATFKLAASVVLFPIAWAGEGWVAWWLGGGWLLAAFMAGLAPGGFVAIAWSERLGRARRDVQAWLRFLGDRDLQRHLAARRRAIMRELEDLVALAPPAEVGG
jgi:1-acyl-sn-glycerol-3-phosphate acyltransferase